MGLVTAALVRHLQRNGLAGMAVEADESALLAPWLENHTKDTERALLTVGQWFGLPYRHAPELPLSFLSLPVEGERGQIWRWADGTCCCTRLPDDEALTAYRSLCGETPLYLTDSLTVTGHIQSAPRPPCRTTAGDESLEALLNAPAGHVDRTIGALLFAAISRGATDLHLTPARDALLADCRVDGRLSTVARLPLTASEELINKIKLACRMDIAEHRLPQDGQLTLSANGTLWQMRAATLPLAQGEKAVIRLLPESQRSRSLTDLGFSAEEAERLLHLIRRPQGLVLLTGPTNSGKTTLLYALLSLLARERRAIYTIEDPIEALLPQVQQMQVNVRAGFTFAAGLRGALRCDPDVLAVGELRDDESAQIAARAALAGHLVLATLHAGGAQQTVGRLREMSLTDGMIGAVLSGVVNGRLMQAACPNCAGSGELDGHCCPHCMGSGTGGRLGIHELWLPDESDRTRIESGQSTRTLRAAALAEGFRTCADDAAAKSALLIHGEQLP